MGRYIAIFQDYQCAMLSVVILILILILIITVTIDELLLHMLSVKIDELLLNVFVFVFLVEVVLVVELLVFVTVGVVDSVASKIAVFNIASIEPLGVIL